MSFRRPLSSVSKDSSEKRVLPLPSATSDIQGHGEKEQTILNESTLSDTELTQGIKNLEFLLHSLGFNDTLSERITNRLREIDNEINRINSEISQLEQEKNNLLVERGKITEILRVFAGIRK